MTEARKLNQKPSLMKAIVKNYGPSFSLYAVIVALVDLVGRFEQIFFKITFTTKFQFCLFFKGRAATACGETDKLFRKRLSRLKD